MPSTYIFTLLFPLPPTGAAVLGFTSFLFIDVPLLTPSLLYFLNGS
jgi:hypothetical protein